MMKKIINCIRECRLPYTITEYKIFFVYKWWYVRRMQKMTDCYNKARGNGQLKAGFKCLYASPVGQGGKEYLRKIIEKFGHEHFDYLIFVYDGTAFEEDVFKKCTIIREKRLRWYFLKKYVTPEYCQKYDYIFLWPDDIDVLNFSYIQFLDIMARNHLEMAQPALSEASYASFKITRWDPSFKVGRFTDYVENMVPIFTREAWEKYWNMMHPDKNFWGWGYEHMAKSICGFSNMGIVDCETVQHVSPVKSQNTVAPKEMREFLRKNKKYKCAEQVSYGELK